MTRRGLGEAVFAVLVVLVVLLLFVNVPSVLGLLMPPVMRFERLPLPVAVDRQRAGEATAILVSRCGADPGRRGRRDPQAGDLMALKAMVTKPGLPDAGALLGVFDAGSLPPLPRDNQDAEVAEYVDTAGQGPGQVWDRQTRAFVAPAVPPAVKEAVEAGGVQLAHARWSMWRDVQAEMTAGGNPALATYAGARKTLWRALLVQAVIDHQAAS